MFSEVSRALGMIYLWDAELNFEKNGVTFKPNNRVSQHISNIRSF